MHHHELKELGALDAGLLYVVFDAQDRFIFNVKHQSAAAMVQALALDAAMIISPCWPWVWRARACPPAWSGP